MPDRVLELNMDDHGQITIKLVKGLTLCEAEPYVCLSHRWGPSTQRCRTTGDTLGQHMIDIPWSKLPKTFQEAATFTLRLGMRYIWIDSLCIVQDDEDDWRVQSAKMCSVYSGAKLTVAAVWALDSDQGLFSQIPFIPVGGLTRDAPQHMIRGNASHSTDELTLFSRGWVFQERLLSRRIAYFSAYELRFECLEKTYCRCAKQTPNVDWSPYYRGVLSSYDEDEAHECWDRIVERYSRLQLSFVTDKLPALIGVAERYQRIHGPSLGRYVAGMWEGTIFNHITWTPANPKDPVLRPSSYRGPSWSWASFPGPISLWSHTSENPKLSLVGCCIELASDSPYGDVTHAELTVKGLVAAGTLRTLSWPSDDDEVEEGAILPLLVHNEYSRQHERPNHVRHPGSEDAHHFFGPDGMEGLPFHSDFPIDSEGDGHIPAGSKLYTLRIRYGQPMTLDGDSITSDDYWPGSALILQAVQHRGQTKYKRVGVLESQSHWDDDLNMLDDFEHMQTLTII